MLLEKITNIYEKVKGKLTKEEILYSGDFINLIKEVYSLPNNKTITREKIVKNGGKDSVIIVATDSNGIPYICESMVEGWGVTPDFISENFKTFINGRYISQHNGYTSAMYVERFFIEPLVASTTNLIVMACEGVIEIPENVICNLFIVNSDVVLSGSGVCYVKTYGDNTIKYDETLRHHNK